MSEFDLVPTAYRRGLWVRRWLTRLSIVLVGIVLVVATTKAVLVYGTRTYTQEVEELHGRSTSSDTLRVAGVVAQVEVDVHQRRHGLELGGLSVLLEVDHAGEVLRGARRS